MGGVFPDWRFTRAAAAPYDVPMQIYLVRHGIAQDRDANVADGERQLTDEGVEKTRQAAGGLAKVIDPPEIILTSPLARAVQTAQIVSDVFGAPVEQAPVLAEPNVRAMVDMLEERGEYRLILVGHEPTLSELAELLCFGQVAGRVVLKKAGGIGIATEGLPRPGSGELHWLATPKMLRKLA